MPDSSPILEGNSEVTPLSTFVEKAYLDYSMYVILDRALPHIADGLKPVQRRIVYAMSELGLNHNSKHKKAARTVGDVLGKYHPHGDSACYEAMVLMAQPFSCRYPLIDGQGNWGAPDDPRSFAAMRYTEARLTSYAASFLEEVNQGTVSWKSNFDGSMQEPQLLPARLPNILLNGVSGIAVGMATDIPPHNLAELVEACIYMLNHPRATLDNLLNYIKAPDFSGGGELISSHSVIRQIYSTGKGTLRLRAKINEESSQLVITELPQHVSGSKVLEQIADQMNSKKLPMVTDLRDESDAREPIRLVLELKSNRVDKQSLMDHLFASTDLEKTVRVNLNVIGIDGRPQVKDLVLMLKEWLSYRIATVRRRLEHQLVKIDKRLHILQGLLVAFLNIDEVIEIIRAHENPKTELQHRFGITEIQAESILEIKLRQLAKLEEIKIRAEQDELSKHRDTIAETLDSDNLLKKLIEKELRQDSLEFVSERRTSLIERKEAKAFKEEELISSEPVTVILSKHNWVRSAKGQDVDPAKLNYKTGDAFARQAYGRNNQFVAFVDGQGRVYSIQAHKLPSARSQGEPLTSKFQLADKSDIVGMVCVQEQQIYLISSNAGYGFVCEGNQLISRNRAGKALISLVKHSEPLAPSIVADNHSHLVAVTSKGYMIVIAIEELPNLAKGKGIKIMQIPTKSFTAGERMVAITTINEGQKLCIYSGKRHLTLKQQDWQAYKCIRARRGLILPHGLRNTSALEVIA